MEINEGAQGEKILYDLNRKAAKASVLLFGDIDQ